MDGFTTKGGNRSPLHQKLAFLALTNTIDQWNSEYPRLASQLLDDKDQHLLSECYAAHLMPTAPSLWWNGNNASIATCLILPEAYPSLNHGSWKGSKIKASDILRTWREDAARLYPFSEIDDDDHENTSIEDMAQDPGQESENVISFSRSLEQCRVNDQNDFDEYNRDVTYIAESPASNKKRKADSSLSQVATPKRAKQNRSIYDDESSDDEILVRRQRPHARANVRPRRPAALIITPPHVGESTPTILIDSDSDDEEPVAPGRRQGRGERKESIEPVMVNPSRLSLTPICTVTAIEPVEALQEKHSCIATLDSRLCRQIP
ncbi:hypothetical protein CORC01_00302 [Colletotrichum orchidophilum]|uniref:Uncharacterized protein n=1 Tax=Colletotrichum orchidophilum TaxID=1209926 RepID=A0A1G4BSS3_9PEZI|nr:uncharacterized protein CORC01_00302 [Colletotrichum orchidophilum]OHF04450.1 hypothetical protein CORC01_00302 [Colletotrichum orchidophilum]